MFVANFWEYFDNKWEFGEQIRISDGMLFSVIVQHLAKLNDEGVVGSMVVFDYDQEPHSAINYGQVVPSKVTCHIHAPVPSHKTRKKMHLFQGK